jgi:cytochrome c-type biogenesis protein CcmH
MMLWVAVALMTGTAVLAVLWPLSRRARVLPSGGERAVYRDQLQEIDRDLAAGRIGAPEAAAARLEVSRRLLAAPGDEAETAAAAPIWPRRTAAVAALVILSLGAGSLYLALGSPSLPGAPASARANETAAAPSLATLIAQVEAHLAKNPEDGRGWEIIAPVYMRLGRFQDEVTARRNALRLLGSTPTREGDFGEALVAAQNGIVTDEAKAAFERALALDPKDFKARYFTGLAAEQDGRRIEAAEIWRAMLKDAPPGAPWVELVTASLARVDPTAVAAAPPGTPPAAQSAPPGPSAQDMAAATDMSPEQRSEMIRGMVARLAERLKADGSDVEGWLRLVRSYAVLGEREKARAAAADARQALGSDADKIRRLDDLVQGLGLEG